MKKVLLLFAIILIVSTNFFAKPLTKSVGFKTLLLEDNSRQFNFKESKKPSYRPIRLFIWYPATKKNTYSMRFSDYLYASSLTKQPNQLNSFEKENLQKKLLETLSFFKVTKDQLRNLLNVKINVSQNAREKKGKFPLIILGNVGDGFFYTSTAEILASNGYVVVGLPSLGMNEDEPCGYDLNCLNLQQNDLEFAIKKIKSFENIDFSKIGLLAWSFSGLTVANLQMKHQSVKAVVSLDAATGYQYGKEILSQLKDFDMGKTIVPFLHFHGLGGNSRVVKNFDYFNSYNSKEKRLVTFKNLQHSDFISLYGNWVRYAKKELRFKESKAIRWVNLITNKFFDAYLKNDRNSRKFINNSLNKNQETAEIFQFSNSFVK